LSKRFTPEEIVRILCEADAGCSVKELSERYGFSMKSYQQWRDRLVGSQASLAQRLAQLEEENERLRRRHLEELALQLKGSELCRGTPMFPSWWASHAEPVDWPKLPALPESPAIGSAPSKKTRPQKRRVRADDETAELQC
jgi:putative transposase